jgi:hypothetical protein
MIITVNGERLDLSRYDSFHAARHDRTMALVRELGGGRTLELGGHPWTMTARLLTESSISLLATVSAEEVTAWPDEIPITRHHYTMQTPDGRREIVGRWLAGSHCRQFHVQPCSCLRLGEARHRH